jgi:competence protein ComEA
MVSDIRTEPEWKDTVEQMVSLGADGTGDQLEAVMRVLLRTLTKVNVNTAPATQLPLVLDITEATARAVVKYRAEHGKFKSLADLKKVPGINAAKLDTRKDRVAF